MKISGFLNSIFDQIKFQINDILFTSDSAFHYYWMLSFILVSLLFFGFNFSKIKMNSNFLRSANFKSELKKDFFFWSLRFLYKPFIFVFLAFNYSSIEKLVYQYTTHLGIGFRQPIIPLDSVMGSVFVALLIFICRDFVSYLSHFLQHKVKWFWYFHMTHHLATSLSPLTKYRVHPIEYLHIILVPFLLEIPIAIFIFKMFKVHGNDHSLAIILGLNYVLYYSLIHFRHSHIKIGYGFLSPILISPVMHQVHHSNSKKHFDKNFSVIFSFWDNLFHTMYIPKHDENFQFGIKGYSHFINQKSYWFEIKFPFILIYRDIRKSFQKKKIKSFIPDRIINPIRKSKESFGFTLPEIMMAILLFSFVTTIGSSILIGLIGARNNQLKTDSVESDLELLITSMHSITSNGVNVRYLNGELNGAVGGASGEGFVRSYNYRQDSTMGTKLSDTLMFFARENTRSNTNPATTVSTYRPTGVFFIRKVESNDPNLRRGSQIVIDFGSSAAGVVSPLGSNTITINGVSDLILDQPQFSEGSVLHSIRMRVTMIYPINSTKPGIDCLGPSLDIQNGIICNPTSNIKPYRTVEKSFTLTFPNNKRQTTIAGGEFEDGIYVFPPAQ